MSKINTPLTERELELLLLVIKDYGWLDIEDELIKLKRKLKYYRKK